MTRPGSSAISRVPMRAPMTRPTSCAGSTAAATKPRCTLVEVEHLLVEQRRRATTKPMSDAARNGSAYQMRRRLSIFHTMRHPSANDGGASSVMSASVEAPIAPPLLDAAHRLAQPQPSTTKTKRRERRRR